MLDSAHSHNGKCRRLSISGTFFGNSFEGFQMSCIEVCENFQNKFTKEEVATNGERRRNRIEKKSVKNSLRLFFDDACLLCSMLLIVDKK